MLVEVHFQQSRYQCRLACTMRTHSMKICHFPRCVNLAGWHHFGARRQKQRPSETRGKYFTNTAMWQYALPVSLPRASLPSSTTCAGTALRQEKTHSKTAAFENSGNSRARLLWQSRLKIHSVSSHLRARRFRFVRTPQKTAVAR